MKEIIALFVALIVGLFAIVAIILITYDNKINRFDHRCHSMGGTALHARDLSLCVRDGLIVGHS